MTSPLHRLREIFELDPEIRLSDLLHRVAVTRYRDAYTPDNNNGGEEPASERQVAGLLPAYIAVSSYSLASIAGFGSPVARSSDHRSHVSGLARELSAQLASMQYAVCTGACTPGRRAEPSERAR
jgi:hypothetical protein